MSSQKNASLKHCIKCTNLLTNENWNKYDSKVGRYICSLCRKEQDKNRQQKDVNYNNNQKNRFRRRRSAVIMAYGNKCNFCYEDKYEKLTIDNISGSKRVDKNIIDYLYNNTVQDNMYQVLCWNCSYSKNIKYKDKYALRYKQKIIAAYGERCAECQEYRIERLIVDMKIKKYTGVCLYRWLIKNQFPKNLELQIMCYNCNYSKLAALKLSIEEPIKT